MMAALKKYFKDHQDQASELKETELEVVMVNGVGENLSKKVLSVHLLTKVHTFMTLASLASYKRPTSSDQKNEASKVDETPSLTKEHTSMTSESSASSQSPTPRP